MAEIMGKTTIGRHIEGVSRCMNPECDSKWFSAQNVALRSLRDPQGQVFCTKCGCAGPWNSTAEGSLDAFNAVAKATRHSEEEEPREADLVISKWLEKLVLWESRGNPMDLSDLKKALLAKIKEHETTTAVRIKAGREIRKGQGITLDDLEEAPDE